MHSKWVFKHSSIDIRGRVHFLMALWIVSFTAGLILSAMSSVNHVAVLRAVFSVPPNPMCNILTCILPAAISAITWFTPFFIFSCFAVFMCGISHGFCGFTIYIAQGSSAWLLQPLMLFEASCSSVLMWWLIFQRSKRHYVQKNIRVAGILSCLIYCIDFLLVTPLVDNLSKYI